MWCGNLRLRRVVLQLPLHGGKVDMLEAGQLRILGSVVAAGHLGESGDLSKSPFRGRRVEGGFCNLAGFLCVGFELC